MKSEKARQALVAALAQGEPQLLAIQTSLRQFKGAVHLTPSCVKRDPKIKFGFQTPRYKYILSAHKGAVELSTSSWEQREFPATAAEIVPVGIYQAGVEFPESCCVCLKQVTHYEIVELVKRQWLLRGGFRNIRFSREFTYKKVQRIVEALSTLRYWYAIPFCSEHSLSSGAIKFGNPDNLKMILDFANQEYGRQFGELNGLEGRWLTQSSQRIQALAGLGTIVGGVIALFGIPALLVPLLKLGLDQTVALIISVLVAGGLGGAIITFCVVLKKKIGGFLNFG
jgi:hypothetical protein